MTSVCLPTTSTSSRTNIGFIPSAEDPLGPKSTPPGELRGKQQPHPYIDNAIASGDLCRPLACKFCHATFAKAYCLRNHLVVMHQTGGKYMCTTCNRQYLQRSRFIEHMARHADISGDYTCHFCASVMSSGGHYVTHLQECVTENMGHSDR